MDHHRRGVDGGGVALIAKRRRLFFPLRTPVLAARQDQSRLPKRRVRTPLCPGAVRRCCCPSYPERRSSGETLKNAGLNAMPVEMTEKQAVNRGELSRIETGSPGEGVSVEHETDSPSPLARQSTRRRRLLLGVLGALILAVVGVFGIPWIRLAFNTVSTDDAYVNGHVTFVAPRVSRPDFPGSGG